MVLLHSHSVCGPPGGRLSCTSTHEELPSGQIPLMIFMTPMSQVTGTIEEDQHLKGAAFTEIHSSLFSLAVLGQKGLGTRLGR